MTPCAYCGHPPEHHDEQPCRGAVAALPAGRRRCHCTAYRPPEETP